MPAEYDLAELERLEKAATPGPMFQDCDLLFVQGKEINHAVAYVSSGMDDAALLRALRNAAPAMLRDLRELEARRKGEWKGLNAENAALPSLREAFAAGPEMGRAKMALFLRAERDECLESCKGLARLVRDNIHLGRELQCANAMLEDALETVEQTHMVMAEEIDGLTKNIMAEQRAGNESRFLLGREREAHGKTQKRMDALRELAGRMLALLASVYLPGGIPRGRIPDMEKAINDARKLGLGE